LVDLILWPVILAPLIAAAPAALLISLRFHNVVLANVYLTWFFADASGNYLTLYLILVSGLNSSFPRSSDVRNRMSCVGLTAGVHCRTVFYLALKCALDRLHEWLLAVRSFISRSSYTYNIPLTNTVYSRFTAPRLILLHICMYCNHNR
jgi:hypothetical protein